MTNTLSANSANIVIFSEIPLIPHGVRPEISLVSMHVAPSVPGGEP